MSMATGNMKTPKGYSQFSIANKTPQQMGLFETGANALQGGFPQVLQQMLQMAQGGTPESWAQAEAPALRQFGQLQGNIASRFSGMGSGARKSSGFQNTQNAAASDLSEKLQSNRMGLQNQATQQLMDLYQNLMGQDLQHTGLVQKQKPWWQDFLSGLGGTAAESAGNFGTLGVSKWAGLFK